VKSLRPFLALAAALTLSAGCAKKDSAPPTGTAAAAPHAHEHHAPHGGTAIVLGDEAYHLELVLDAAAGKLGAYVLDGEMENFIRSAMTSFAVATTVGGEKRTLVFKAVADPATGETVGDTSFFEAQAEWLKTTREFDGVIDALAIRGSTFRSVAFNFPKGNEAAGHDHAAHDHDGHAQHGK
jgi:hypothetical protein